MLIGTHVRLRVMDSTDGEYVRRLRNHPEIVKHFQSRQFISDVQQMAFVSTLKDSSDQLYFIAEMNSNDQPFGVYSIRRIDHRNQRAENGVFLEPDSPATGVESLEAAFLLLQYEFQYLNLRKILADVLSTNRRAIRFNEALGFQLEGVRREHVFYDGLFHDLREYSLFRDDFYKSPTPAIRAIQGAE